VRRSWLGDPPDHFVEHKLLLVGCRLALFGFRDRRNELGLAALLDDLPGRLAIGVKLPMTLRAGVGEFKIGCSKNGLDIFVFRRTDFRETQLILAA